MRCPQIFSSPGDADPSVFPQRAALQSFGHLHGLLVGTRTGALSVTRQEEWKHKVDIFGNLHHHSRGQNWDTECIEFTTEVDISTGPSASLSLQSQKVHEQTYLNGNQSTFFFIHRKSPAQCHLNEPVYQNPPSQCREAKTSHRCLHDSHKWITCIA